MNKRKTLILLYLVLVTAFIFSLPSYPACSSRQKSMVCQRCEQKVLSSSECMSTCPMCPSSPTRDLKNVYNFSVDVEAVVNLFPVQKTHNYTLFIEDQFPDGIFTYKVQYVNGAYNGVVPKLGITSDDFLTFAIPLIETFRFAEPQLVTLHCIAFIDSNGLIDNKKPNNCNGHFTVVGSEISTISGVTLTGR